jgi:hypothetical protein
LIAVCACSSRCSMTAPEPRSMIWTCRTISLHCLQ